MKAIIKNILLKHISYIEHADYTNAVEKGFGG